MSVLEWFSKQKGSSAHSKTERLDIPGDLWIKCNSCNAVLYNKELEENLKVCPNCGYHFRLSFQERISLVADENSFEEFDGDLIPQDFLKFEDTKPYIERIAENHKKTKVNEAIISGKAMINGFPVIMCIMDFSFLGGSMGSVVGEKFTRAAEKAIELNIPFMVFTASGGARMQEGIVSLMQMAKTSAVVGRLNDLAIPYIVILTDPTTGGTTASFAMLGDIHIAEKGALIAFAGPRVIEQTIRQKLPKGFQRAEYLLEHGFVDIVTARADLKIVLGRLLKHFFSKTNSLKDKK